jgi:hypothetical protein
MSEPAREPSSDGAPPPAVDVPVQPADPTTSPFAAPAAPGTAVHLPAGTRLQLVSDRPAHHAPPSWWPTTWVWGLRLLVVPVLLAAALAVWGIWAQWSDGGTLAWGTVVWGALFLVAAGIATDRLLRVRASGLAWVLAMVALAVGFVFGYDQNDQFQAYPNGPLPAAASTVPGTTMAGDGWYCTAQCFGGPVRQRVARRYGAPSGNASKGGWTCAAGRCYGGPMPASVARSFGARPTTAAATPGSIHGQLAVDPNGSWNMVAESGTGVGGTLQPGATPAAPQAPSDVTLNDLAPSLGGSAIDPNAMPAAGADAGPAGAVPADPNTVTTPCGATPATAC